MLKRAALVSSSVMLILMPFTAHEEGLHLASYLDPVGVPTICYGETENVKIGDKKTKKECDAMFYAKLGVFAYAIEAEIQSSMNPNFHAALTSWSYNVGLGAARKSTLMKKAKSGDFIGACNELPKWKYAGGKPILAARRERERQLCLKGIEDAKIVPSSSRSISSWNN